MFTSFDVGVGYIFTEYFFEIFSTYLNIYLCICTLTSIILSYISYALPYVVKYLIGYCHFYYQLGYGLIFYIYIYRRRQAKKNNNWSTFYGNSISNWVIFNISVLNKYIFNHNFFVFISTLINQSLQIIKFWINTAKYNNVYSRKFTRFSSGFINALTLYTWTPLFKRTSYIAFTSFLKRFSKRK